MPERGFARWLVLAAVILAADQATKFAITRAFDLYEQLTLTPFLNLVLVHNRGAAFSFLAGASGWQTGFFIVIAIAAVVWITHLLRRHPNDIVFSAALALVLGGALGNVVDRLRLGVVVDFLDFHAFGWHWPAFNVADAAITCGAILLVWDGLRAGRRGPQNRGPA